MPRKTNLCGKSTRFHSWHGPARFGPRPAAGRTRAVGGRAQRCGRAAEGAPRGPCLRGVISSFLAASRRTTRAQHSVRAVCRSVFAASAGLSEGEALTEACPHAQPLCTRCATRRAIPARIPARIPDPVPAGDALERALSHGLGKTRVWTFWAFAKRVRNLGSGTARRVADVASVKWITTDHGRTRALIRRCLNAGAVRELMQVRRAPTGFAMRSHAPPSCSALGLHTGPAGGHRVLHLSGRHARRGTALRVGLCGRGVGRCPIPARVGQRTPGSSRSWTRAGHRCSGRRCSSSRVWSTPHAVRGQRIGVVCEVRFCRTFSMGQQGTL